jgi:hypothetical protein
VGAALLQSEGGKLAASLSESAARVGAGQLVLNAPSGKAAVEAGYDGSRGVVRANPQWGPKSIIQGKN